MAFGNIGKRNFEPRYEKKYIISPEMYLVLSKRIKCLLQMDEFSVDENGYFISSLYFDDAFDTAYNEKLSGSDNRRKYRLRTYNKSDSLIKIECKEKHRGMIYKRSDTVSKEDYIKLSKGLFDEIDLSVPLLSEIYSLNREKLLSPVVAVNYVREAYCHPLSDTRITFDKKLEAGFSNASYLGEDTVSGYMFEGAPYNDSIILEVKFNKFLPEFIKDISSIGISETSASKYIIYQRTAVKSISAYNIF